MQGEMTVGGWREARVARVGGQRLDPTALRRAHCTQGMPVQRRTPIRRLAEGKVTPGSNLPGNWPEGEYVRGKGQERSGASGHAVSQGAGGNCVAMASIRSVVLRRPEHVVSAAW